MFYRSLVITLSPDPSLRYRGMVELLSARGLALGRRSGLRVAAALEASDRATTIEALLGLPGVEAIEVAERDPQLRPLPPDRSLDEVGPVVAQATKSIQANEYRP
jgi:hypothetical protein